MKRYSFFAPLWLSWTPGDLYCDLARNGRGAGVLWLFFLTLAGTMLVTLELASRANQARTDWLPGVVKQVPDIQITNGVFSTPDNQPVEIHDPKDKSVIAVLLPGESSIPTKYSATPVVVLEDRMVMQNDLGQSHEIDFNKQMDFSLTNAELAAKSDLFLSVAAWLFAPFILAVWFVARLIYWLVLSVTAVIANSGIRGDFSYGALLRITAAALTPTILLNMLLLLLGMNVPLVVGLLWFVVTNVLIILAVRAAARPDETSPLDSDRSATPPPPIA